MKFCLEFFFFFEMLEIEVKDHSASKITNSAGRLVFTLIGRICNSVSYKEQQ